MIDDILHYDDIAKREGTRRQRGMNFRHQKNYSMILMSVREGAPYEDDLDEESGLLIYSGHDVPTNVNPNPKEVDQLLSTPNGKLTENGKFFKAALDYMTGESKPETVQVYEKIMKGMWSDKGTFHLVFAEVVHDGKRNVFKFHFKPVEERLLRKAKEVSPSRLIPSEVKVEVWNRDKGRCVICESKENLHFDHDVPFSKGGSSLTAKNIQLLCAKCNLKKSNKIMALLPLLLPMSLGAAEIFKITKG